MRAIGLMSGTSADALDIALVEINENSSPPIDLIKFETVAYPADIKKRISNLVHSLETTLEEIADLNIELGKFYGDSVNKFIEKNNLSYEGIKVIGSHGQTIFHRSKKITGKSATLQIGDGAVIAKITSIPVVSDFRIDDIAAGGEGAPLTPYFHYILFKDYGENVAVLNIGGISNITVIPVEGKKEDVIAFDTGPGNSLIDIAVSDLFNEGIDRNGEISSKGSIDGGLLKYLLSHSYFQIPPPKSTGRKVFGKKFYTKIRRKAAGIPPEELLRTLVEFTASSIFEAYKNFIFPETRISTLFISGGGTKNKTLFNSIREKFKDVKVKTLEDAGLNSRAVEAMAFAYFAHETFFKKEPINIPSVTGAEKAVICGKISLP